MNLGITVFCKCPHTQPSSVLICLLGKRLPLLSTVIRNKSIWRLLCNRLYCGVRSVFWDTSFCWGQNLGYKLSLGCCSVSRGHHSSVHTPTFLSRTPVGTNVKEMGSTIVKTGKDSGAVKDLEYKANVFSMWEALSKKHEEVRDVACCLVKIKYWFCM